MRVLRHSPFLAGFASLLVLLTPAASLADTFSQTNLISDVSGLAASTDPALANPWGMAFTATSPFWIANQASGTSALTDGAGNVNALLVNIPGGGPPSGPTGVVANTSGFVLNGNPSRFIFDTLNGTIAAWNSGTTATTVATTAGAVYTGLAIASSGGSSYLYAADSTGHIRVFDTNFAPTNLPGGFTDPNALPGYVPFNIQLIGTSLYVTYAQLGPRGTALPGGYVDVFNTDGSLVQRLATGGPLFAPWGITLAPSTFGSFGNDLLIGNFGNGEINAYSLAGAFEGTLDGTNGLPIVNDNLWALDFRTGGTNNNPNALYFTAGIDNQTEGLFGEITETPEASPSVLVGFGVLAFAAARGIPRARHATSAS